MPNAANTTSPTQSRSGRSVPAFPAGATSALVRAPFGIPDNDVTRAGAWINAGSCDDPRAYHRILARRGSPDVDGLRVNFHARLSRDNYWASAWKRTAPADFARILTPTQRAAVRAIGAWMEHARVGETVPVHQRRTNRRPRIEGLCSEATLELLYFVDICDGGVFTCTGLTDFGRSVFAWL